MPKPTPKLRQKVVSRHLKRRRADARCQDLNERLATAIRAHRADAWLGALGMPKWTNKFEVGHARLHWHYTVVAKEQA